MVADTGHKTELFKWNSSAMKQIERTYGVQAVREEGIEE